MAHGVRQRLRAGCLRRNLRGEPALISRSANARRQLPQRARKERVTWDAIEPLVPNRSAFILHNRTMSSRRNRWCNKTCRTQSSRT